jgi:leishmanolysin
MSFSPSLVKPISKLTLALLEDSGWYKPEYSKADVLTWGLGAGCSMSSGDCNSEGFC